MKRYKAIFIDWDNTIGDWSSSEAKALHDLYEQYHLAEFFDNEKQFVTIYETHNQQLWEQYGIGQISKAYLQHERFEYPLAVALSLSAIPRGIADLADHMAADFLLLTNKYFTLMPDAAEVVRTLSEEYPLTILSNGFQEVQYYKIRQSGLEDCFRHVLISEEVGINKPQPAIFEHALSVNGVTADQALMIGDSYYSDISGAKAAGIDQLWITTDPQAETATYIVPKMADIIPLLCQNGRK